MSAYVRGSRRPTDGRHRFRPGLALGLALGLVPAGAGLVQAAPTRVPGDAGSTSAVDRQDQHPGKPVYDRWCAQCHGAEGRGDGVAAAYMLPRPRDFTQALYQIRATPSGALPLDSDILRVIDEGMPGTAMPGWKDRLSRAEREALVGYLKTFSHFFEQPSAMGEPIVVGGAPRRTEEGLAEGREFYDRIECWKCHGQTGRGDGPSAPTQADDDGFPIRPADLTENWHFNGGGRVEDIYLRLRTGLDGTPMPSFSDLIESGFMTDAQLWNLAHYVRSLSPEESPRIREVVRAARIDGALPATPDDSAWTAAERSYVPLVGQVIVPPRWFAPTVDGVWVEALHNGRELALRLTWNDPSKSPDAAWSEWQRLVASTLEPREGPPIRVPAPDAPPELPDAFAVQFPLTIPEGMERPYFLMGDAREPVYLWRWQSAPARAEEALARGFDRIETLPAASQTLDASAVFDQGQWRLVFRRALVADSGGAAAGDAPDRLRFEAGRAIPIAFYAWDGSNAEAGGRAAISSWYFVYLDQPTPTTVYTTPAIAMLLTAGLGLVVVVRAQRRESNHEIAE